MASVILRPSQPWGNVVQLGNKTYPGPLNRRRAGGRLNFSSLTTAWLVNVEAADLAGGEPPLEDEVYNAMGVFADWRIPLGGACCLMTGARTWEGALTPMVGPAPDGVNLEAGDYDRLQITPDATKYIALNYANTTDLQDSRHLYTRGISDYDPPAAFMWLLGNVAATAGFSLLGHSTTLNRFSSSSSPVPITRQLYPAGGLGVARNSSSEMQRLFDSEVTTSSTASVTPLTGNYFLWGNGFTVGALRPASCYSVGPYISLSEIDQRMAQAEAQIWSALDPDGILLEI